MHCRSILISSLLFCAAARGAPSVRDSSKVSTPQGLRDPANVHLVPKGGEVRIVGDEVHLLDASGTVLHVAAHTLDTPPPEAWGWTAWAQWINNATADASPISFFNTTLTVPPAPASSIEQIIYLFNGLIPTESGSIIQPVLQWGVTGAGGGNYWGVASWYVNGWDSYSTELVEVSEGQELEGVITLTWTDGTNYDYQAEFTGIEGTTFVATNSVELTWASETLEAYYTIDNTDYPVNTVFSGIYIETLAGTPQMTWSVDNDVADEFFVTVVEDGPTNAQITITSECQGVCY